MARRAIGRELMASWLVASVVVAMASGVGAQARFQVLSRNTVPDVGGLSIYTFRDEQLSTCFLVFIMEQSSVARETGTPPIAAPLPPGPQRAEQPAADDARPAPDRPTQEPKKWAAAPWATPTPGEPTGGWEHLAEAMRLALVDPATADALAEPVSAKLTDVAERLGRIELLLKNVGTSQRLAVLPVTCSAAERK